MNADEAHGTDDQSPKELTPEEARIKREFYLALYRQQDMGAGQSDADEPDSPDSMLTTFVLPGD